MIRALVLKHKVTSRLVQSSGALSVDPPSARRTRSSGAMSAGSTRMSAIDVKHISSWSKSELENEKIKEEFGTDPDRIYRST